MYTTCMCGRRKNPHAIRHFSFQRGFSVKVWAGIVDDYVIEPYVIRGPLDGGQNADFHEETLPLLFENVPLHVRESMWFQHDGAPPNFARRVRN
jgi:hypothetical protein